MSLGSRGSRASDGREVENMPSKIELTGQKTDKN